MMLDIEKYEDLYAEFMNEIRLAKILNTEVSSDFLIATITKFSTNPIYRNQFREYFKDSKETFMLCKYSNTNDCIAFVDKNMYDADTYTFNGFNGIFTVTYSYLTYDQWLDYVENES